jgi:hypothetical protein
MEAPHQKPKKIKGLKRDKESNTNKKKGQKSREQLRTKEEIRFGGRTSATRKAVRGNTSQEHHSGNCNCMIATAQ